ncbi:MAG: hypothetical protein LBV55_04285, partial [Acholeplasmatales bacterium]|nr:hypothetical protein [Acholeplasmatales bacterium]
MHLFPNETVEVRLFVNQPYNTEYYTIGSNITFMADPGINVIMLPAQDEYQLQSVHFLIQVDQNV